MLRIDIYNRIFWEYSCNLSYPMLPCPVTTKIIDPDKSTFGQINPQTYTLSFAKSDRTYIRHEQERALV